MDVRMAFKKTYKSYNFITPHILRYGVINEEHGIIYELSYGKGLNDNNIYGVTVAKYDVIKDEGKPLHEHSLCFPSLSKAEYYINSLKERKWDSI